eukprot:NODE_31_length_32452_cov_0.352672.p26 type:complete len:111 gc:universal NODE_31_length_32452_cov_0.352672:12540-12208(-)
MAHLGSSLINIIINKEFENFKIVNNTLYTCDEYYISLQTLANLGYRITLKGKLMRKCTRGNGRKIKYYDNPSDKCKLERLQLVINSDKIMFYIDDVFLPKCYKWKSKKIL